jgi:hypothetical protein
MSSRAVARLSPQPIRYIVDTSADPDVVGGNAKLAAAGRNITSFSVGSSRTNVAGLDLDGRQGALARERAHADAPGPERARRRRFQPTRGRPKRLASGGARCISTTKASKSSSSRRSHRRARYSVFFRKSDVIVAGNIIDADRFPMIDLAKGGSLQGEIAALNRIIEIAIPPGPFVGLPGGRNASDTQQGGTDVLPGHGRIFRQIDVVNYRDMIVIISDIVQGMIARKMTLDQVKAADPAKPYKTQYGATSGPWTTDDFVEAAYKSLTTAKS